MIQIQGLIRGKVEDICFEPTKPRFKQNGEIILASTTHAHLTPHGEDTQMSVELPDNTELVSPTSWMWICYERSDSLYMFTIKSDPASYTYAQLRRAR